MHFSGARGFEISGIQHTFSPCTANELPLNGLHLYPISHQFPPVQSPHASGVTSFLFLFEHTFFLDIQVSRIGISLHTATP